MEPTLEYDQWAAWPLPDVWTSSQVTVKVLKVVSLIPHT